MLETDLYPPIKTFLETQGYTVKAEVRDCDVVAVRGDEDPVVVELKTTFSLPLLLQGIDRQAITDAVYVAMAVPGGKGRTSTWRRHRRGILKLCRRLGLGLLTVRPGGTEPAAVEVHLDPAPYRPRPDKRRRAMLLKEFQTRVGDPNEGGSTRRPLITAYRQDALRCVKYLGERGPAPLKDIRSETRVERAAGILQRDVYGWFMRVERGVYELSPRGRTAISDFNEVLRAL
ncbi:MAG: DUF2161 domain-containing phosphodiesterase [Hyphomicrobiales bacterium]